MNKKKIGIMTFHRADNLGAVLQAYALQSALRENWNADAEIIDYLCPGVESDKKQGNGLKGLLLRVYYFWKHRSVEKFRDRYLILSEQCTTESVSEISEKYDAVVTGSDQVWNYACSGWDDTYFLDFVSGDKEKYSYAASIGNYRFAETERSHIQQLLKDFSRISVRENSAKKELENLGVQGIVQCPDPVILLTMERWKAIMSPRRYHQPYVFVYLIQEDVNVMRSAQAYAEAHHCKIISNKISPEFILRGGPDEFLSWICYAECVFTNSFHGTAFALIFNRPLCADVALVSGGINHRVKEILEIAGARHCIADQAAANVSVPNAQNALDMMRKEADSYLQSISEQ